MNIIDIEDSGDDERDSLPQGESGKTQDQNSQFATCESKLASKSFLASLSCSLSLAYQSFGVVYGDLSTSPLYVYAGTFVGKLENHRNPDAVFGVFSLIFWTLTLIPLLKYTAIILSADDNGQGGTFALYSILCRHGKFSLLPNQQAADEELSAYKYGAPGQSMKKYFEKHKKMRTALLLVVLLGSSMLIVDGVMNPAMSVLSSVSALKAYDSRWAQSGTVLLACAILVGLFAMQHFGTRKVGFLFAPVVILWLLSIFAIGLYNIIHWNPKIVLALSPHYIVKFFAQTGKDGWVSLGGVLLCVTGSEAMFANLGHFSACSIRFAFIFVVYPCLVIQYMGQAAYLSKNIDVIPNSFYASIPEPLLWPVFVIATLAAIVGSQAMISATFSIVMQCQALSCFPRVKIVHTSKQIYGQIYIPEINWILMILTVCVAVGFRDTEKIGNAYGLAVLSVMLITTVLMALVMLVVWQRSLLLSIVFVLVFGMIEAPYLLAACMKIPRGGWFSILLSLLFTHVMFVWHYGTLKKYKFDMQNKVPQKWIFALGPGLGIVRVPGIGLIYSRLATGVPPIFSHFITNLPAFHNVLVFVCIKSVPVPCVSAEERFLIGRVCSRPYRMYRCIVRYGFKDIQEDDRSFENMLIRSIAEFIEREGTSHDGRMAVISSSFKTQSTSSLVLSEVEDLSCSARSSDEENSEMRKRRPQVRFQLRCSDMDPSVREELMDLIQAKEAGVAYIMGHSYVKARRSSSFLKRLLIDFGYAFLRRNCRGSAHGLHIPQISLIEVGMTYYL